jgi:hypothetical protein
LPGASSRPDPRERHSMTDLLFLALGVGVFALLMGYAALLRRV